MEDVNARRRLEYSLREVVEAVRPELPPGLVLVPDITLHGDGTASVSLLVEDRMASGRDDVAVAVLGLDGTIDDLLEGDHHWWNLAASVGIEVQLWMQANRDVCLARRGR